MQFKTSSDPVEYPDALSFMDGRVQGIYDGVEEECVWFLEHPSLYTAGTSAKAADLLEARFPVFEAGRGGEYTYHGPGQRVAYVMMGLRKRQKAPDIKAYVWFLEEWVIRTLEAFGIKGERICGRVGIWVDCGDPLSLPLRSLPLPEGRGIKGEGERRSMKKIAAIGVRVRRWVTLHGVSINVNPDLSHFGGIVPCGISDAGVTSMKALGVECDYAALDKVLREVLPTIPLTLTVQKCQ